MTETTKTTDAGQAQAPAKMAEKSIAQTIKEESLKMISPYAQARAAGALQSKMQWGTQLTSAEAQAFESVANARGLSILDGTAYVLGGNLYASLQGRLKHAHDSNTFLGFAVDRPMTKEERDAYGIEKDEYAWICTVRRLTPKGNGEAEIVPFTDFGRASKTENNPIAKKNPVEMAMKRARARALKIAYPIGLQSMEEVDAIDAEFRVVHEEPPTVNPAALALPGQAPKEPAAAAKPSKQPEPSEQTEAEKLAEEREFLAGLAEKEEPGL